MKKEISLNIRIPKELHEKIKKETIKQTIKKNELMTISQIIRAVLFKEFESEKHDI